MSRFRSLGVGVAVVAALTLWAVFIGWAAPALAVIFLALSQGVL